MKTLDDLYREREALGSPEAAYAGMSRESIWEAIEEIESEIAMLEEIEICAGGEVRHERKAVRSASYENYPTGELPY